MNSDTSPDWLLAKYAYELSYSDIDESARDHIVQMIFDVIIISIGAYNEKHGSGLINEDFNLKHNKSEEGSTLWSGRGKMPANLAALCNGTWAEILDYQDVVVDPRNNGHLGVTIIPAAFAVAEREGSSGEELITAIAAGLEVAIAVLRAVGRRHRSEGRGFRTTSIAGPLGASVACAKLLNLDIKQIAYTMGMAGACSPNGLMPSLAPGNGSFGMDKDWVNGQAAQLAVNSADLVKHGMTASDRVVTGEMGIVASHSHGDGQELKVPKGGTPNISNISLKKYACCYGVHSAIEAAKAICIDKGINSDDIDKVFVQVKADSAKTLSTRKISNHMAARFSLPYAVALAVIKKDDISMHDFEEPAIFDQKIIQMMERIEIIADEDLTEFHVQTGGFPGKVEIVVGDIKYSERIDYPAGSSQRPMSWGDMGHKSAELTANHYSDEQRQKIITAGKEIPAVHDINQFSKLL
ncbi:MAG: MmgE/PrpD family protein [Emcibacteraceae bacterium]|nr:MmgE/PrpD family protein [Emcibacteraceae bacterium]MDG1725784.1 MmgE/PrpD family protein [Emcibacteraceae bacterium]